MRYRILSQAKRDIAHAEAWWREHRPEARTGVLEEVGTALEQIVDQPESGLLYGMRGNDLVRRVFLATTSRHLYYAVIKGMVTVLRVYGAKRGAGPRFGSKTSLS